MKALLTKVKILILLLILLALACKEEEVLQNQNGLVAIAGADQSIKINEEVLLDGSASYDRNNKPFAIAWIVKSKPTGSLVALNSASIKTTFKPDVAGIYTIQLKITQGNWFTQDDVVITVAAQVPTGPTSIVLNEDINTNRTLPDIFEDPTKPDYIITQDILVNADLIIEPGVTIHVLQNKGLQIIGTIRAKGTPDKNITFQGAGLGAGFWKGIVIHSNSELNEFEFVTLRQGGSFPFTETGIQANVTLEGSAIAGAALKLSHTVFSESGGYGLYVKGMSTLNRFSNNAFINNATMAAYIPAHQLHKIDVVSFTGTNGVETGGPALQPNEVQWKKLTGSYYVTSNILLRAGVTIEAGASFRMKSGVTLQVTETGYLKSIGTPQQRISFAPAVIGQYWNGLFFNSVNSNNKLVYSEVTYAGLNRIADADYHANVVLGNQASVLVENSIIRYGLGYGLVTKSMDQVNGNITSVNTFEHLQQGAVYPTILNYPDRPSLTGVWLDQWSFHKGVSNIAAEYFNPNTNIWFAGAISPWKMTVPGFGIRFDEGGTFTWNIAELSPPIGCDSYSAEYITGTYTTTSDVITFNQNYWRSKFINTCDPQQNVDITVTPSTIPISYEFNKIYNLVTGEEYWELKFINPGGSTFSFYRR